MRAPAPPPLLFLLLVGCALLALARAAAFFEDGGGPNEEADVDAEAALQDYTDALERLLRPPHKRSCIRRGGNCDHRAKDCCYNSACRCNLWGANCRCQRMGLFQKWGK
ncbi:hypothetical protein R5R35_014184 [Gryllus longicercus]|uniref:Uncharacterized protein n=1 Tax=Gryllus longicercus TaxID=2509291 RepID=A0AAN9ZAF4_9ORTH